MNSNISHTLHRILRGILYGILALAIVLLVNQVMIASGISTGWNNPSVSPTGGNVPPFINTGSVDQVKGGALHVGTSSANSFDFSVTSGVANLIGGLHAKNTTGGPAAQVNTQMYVGFSNAGVVSTPATLDVYGNATIAGAIRDNSLTHTTNTLDPVCVSPSGVLVACNVSTAPTGSVDLTATPTTLPNTGGSTVLRWTSTSVSGCVASSNPSGWSGSKATNNTTGESVALTANKTFTITCNRTGGGTTSDSVTVTVAQANYTWVTGSWGTCSNAQTTRSVTCQSNGQTVNGTNCTQPQPTGTVSMPNSCVSHSQCDIALPGGGTLNGMCNGFVPSTTQVVATGTCTAQLQGYATQCSNRTTATSCNALVNQFNDPACNWTAGPNTTQTIPATAGTCSCQSSLPDLCEPIFTTCAQGIGQGFPIGSCNSVCNATSQSACLAIQASPAGLDPLQPVCRWN